MKQPEATGNKRMESGRGKTIGKGTGPRKKRKRVGIIWLLFVALFAVVCAVVGYLLIILNGERILSANINKLNLDQASVIVDRNDNVVSKLYVHEGNREFVPFKDIPPLVQNAFIATEDKRFYEHSGVDLMGIGRALVKDVIERKAVEGASTITQQLAKNLFLNADKTIFRKGTEASIALALEKHRSKQEILELYLNRIYFGEGQYGVQTAAKYYFNTSVDKLKLWQIATLAGIPKAPSTYNPIKNPEKSMERRNVVLSLMLDQGLITAKEKEAAAKVPYDPDVVPVKNTKYLTYSDYVVQEAMEKTNLSEEELLSGGYRITTAIDTKAQLAMEAEFKKDSRFEKSKDDRKVQGAMVIMDQHDGSVIAMVGGRDYEKQGWNRVTKQRQPGSSFKPIAAYGPAIETGDYFPWSTVQDVKQCFDNGKYCPSNSNRIKYRGAIPMSEAIKESRNVSAVWLLNEIGVKKGLDFADRLGFTLDKQNDRNLSIALGGLTHGVTPLQMVRAYGAFANGGVLQEPHCILSIKNSKGEDVYEYDESNADQVMSPETAYYVTDLLQGVTQRGGTGVRANISGRIVAGKTGTTQHGIKGLKSSANRDVWFVGYTPELTAAVWMGYDKTDKDHLLQNSSGQAAEMFSAVMSKALDGKKRLSFSKPEGVEEKKPLQGVTGLTGQYSPDQVTVELNWNPVNDKNITYKVYRKESTENTFKMIGESNDPTFDDMQIMPDQTYTYYVTAYQSDTEQESEPSAKVTVTVTSEMEPTPSPSPTDGTGDGNGDGNGDGTGDDGGMIPWPDMPTDEPTPPGEGDGGDGDAGQSPTPNPGESPTPTPSPNPSPSPSPSPTPSTTTRSLPNASPSGSSSFGALDSGRTQTPQH